MKNEKKNVGRPPVMSDSDRVAQILNAAENVFKQNGFGMSTMADIAKECSISKKTVYRFFSNKSEVLTAIIRNAGREKFSVDNAIISNEDPKKILYNLITDLAKFVFSVQQIEATRLAISESSNNPEMSKQFYEDSMQNSQLLIADTLVELMEHIDREQAMLYSDLILGAILGPVQIRRLMGINEPDELLSNIENRLNVLFKHLSI